MPVSSGNTSAFFPDAYSTRNRPPPDRLSSPSLWDLSSWSTEYDSAWWMTLRDRSPTGRVWIALMYRSSVRGESAYMEPNRSGPAAGTWWAGNRITRSGLPICHSEASANCRSGGMSARLPRGAPLSTHFTIVAISSSLSDGIVLELLEPDVAIDVPGGISRAATRALIERAHGRASS